MIDRDIAKFSYSCMSDSKWKKLFSVINQSNLELGYCVWKLVDDKEPTKGLIPDYSEIGEDYVGDCGALNGPFEFRRIEWLFVPKSIGFRSYKLAPMKFKTQDLSIIIGQLKSLGKFEIGLSTERIDQLKPLGSREIELSTDGVKIYGYRR